MTPIDRDAKGESMIRRAFGPSLDLTRRMGDSSSGYILSYALLPLPPSSSADASVPGPPKVLFAGPRPAAPFAGVWKSPFARVDHTLFFGVANGAVSLIPRDGVDVGSNGTSS